MVPFIPQHQYLCHICTIYFQIKDLKTYSKLIKLPHFRNCKGSKNVKKKKKKKKKSKNVIGLYMTTLLNYSFNYFGFQL